MKGVTAREHNRAIYDCQLNKFVVLTTKADYLERMSNENTPWLELGRLVSLVAQQKSSTRAELGRITGLARSTISQRVDQLLNLDVLVEAGEGPSSGGRRPTLISLNPAAGVVLAADLGATHARRDGDAER